MKLDVSDLFDHLYDVALFARARFDLAQSLDDAADCDEWHTFCAALSDMLFVPACASRAFAVTHVRVPIEILKKRIFSEKQSANGRKSITAVYARPYFTEKAQFFGDFDSSPVTLSRPKHKLTMWLGQLPPAERDLTPPEYPRDLEEPTKYFVRQWMAMHGPRMSYYEFHGSWCLRRVELLGTRFVRSDLNGEWLQFDDLKEIRQHEFEEIWAAAEDDSDGRA